MTGIGKRLSGAAKADWTTTSRPLASSRSRKVCVVTGIIAWLDCSLLPATRTTGRSGSPGAVIRQKSGGLKPGLQRGPLNPGRFSPVE